MSLFSPPPVQTPLKDNSPSGFSRPWLQWFQAVSGMFFGKTDTATAGTGSTLPATVQGYLVIQINGTQYKVPYYL